MKNRNALIGMIITTAIFAGILFMGLASIDPRSAQWAGFAGVTAALLLFLWALIGTLMLSHRTFRKKDRPVAVTMRQA